MRNYCIQEKREIIAKRKSEKSFYEKRPDFLFGKSDLYVLKSPKKISVED